MPFEAFDWKDYPDTSTLITSARLEAEYTRAAEHAESPGEVRLSHYTSYTFGSSQDYTSALLAALADVQTGGTLYVDIPGILVTTQTLKIPNQATIRGLSRYGTTIKAAASSNLNAVIASTAWVDNAAIYNASQSVRDICVDANGDEQASGDGHGIVLWTYEGRIDNVLVYGGDGDGIRISSCNRAGTENGTASEAYILDCEVRDPGACGIRVYDPDATTDQNAADGYILNCQIQNVGTRGILLDGAAGWSIRGNHLYGLPDSGIKADHAYSTIIAENYIESWGVGATSGIISAIDCYDTVHGPLVIANNHAHYTDSPVVDADVYLQGIYARGSQNLSCDISITGNMLLGTTAATGSYGILVEPQNADATVYVNVAGNSIRGFDQAELYRTNGGSLVTTTPGTTDASIAASVGDLQARVTTLEGTQTSQDASISQLFTRVNALDAGGTTPPSPPPSGTLLHDLGVENGSFSAWAGLQQVGGRVASVISSSTFTPLTKAARFEVVATSGERAELLSEPQIRFNPGDEYWFGFKAWVPSGNSGKWSAGHHTMMQWKNIGTGSPPIELDVRSATGLVLQKNASGGSNTLIAIGSLYDTVFAIQVRVKFTESAGTGEVEVWINGVNTLPTINTKTLNTGAYSYLKSGFYGDASVGWYWLLADWKIGSTRAIVA